MRMGLFILAALICYPFIDGFIYIASLQYFMGKEHRTLSSLSYLRALLAKRRAELARVNTCKTELSGLQNEFFLNQRLVKDPSLTATTWNGVLANKFEDIREDLHFSYQDISQTQLNSVLTAVENKIEWLIDEIESIKRRIAALSD